MGSLYSKMETGNRFMELSVDMFCVAGFDGFFKNLNPSFQKTLGFTTNELMAMPYLEFIHPYDRPATVVEEDRLEEGESHFCVRKPLFVQRRILQMAVVECCFRVRTRDQCRRS